MPHSRIKPTVSPAAWLSCFVGLVSFGMIVLIYGLPTVVVAEWVHRTVGPWRVPTLLIAPMLFATLFVVTSGLLSLPFHRAIVAGKFPRDLLHPIYRGRRFYGTCWTALYYCKPVYWLVLSLPWLKWLAFRLFGYRGQMAFTVYPDTWIRDLPLLDFGPGVYVANRATLGTNMPLKNGRILVDRIQIGEGSLIGHLTLIAAGVTIGDQVEIESGTGVGIKVKIGHRVAVGAACGINHFSQLGDHSVVGAGCRIGFRAKVPANAVIAEISAVRNGERTLGGLASIEAL